jgi:hypothetical protein
MTLHSVAHCGVNKEGFKTPSTGLVVNLCPTVGWELGEP